MSKFSSKKKEVNASTMQNLKLAEDAVLKVKYLLPYGAGNQKTDISYTQGESWARRAMLRDNEYNQDPIQNAGRAVAYQAGNWNEHANVGYTLLAASSLNAPLLRVSDADEDHAYVLIGDPRDPTWARKIRRCGCVGDTSNSNDVRPIKRLKSAAYSLVPTASTGSARCQSDRCTCQRKPSID